MEKEIKDMNIYEKIQAVSNEVKNIEKNMTVGFGKSQYKAVSDIDVTLKVKEAETKYRLVSIPFKQELVKSDNISKINKEGDAALVYTDIVKMTVRIINLDNKDEFIDIESFGRGVDSQDKGFGKASTYARKYALLNAYKIATGEDPDQEPSVQQKVTTEDEKKNIVVDFLLKNNDFRNNTFKHFSIGETDDLSTDQIKTIYLNLKKKNLI